MQATSQEIDLSYIATIFPAIKELKDEQTAIKIASVWMNMFKQSKWEKIEDACFSPDIKERSLVGHVNATVVSALKISEVIEEFQNIKFDRELLLTFGLLHDVSKLVEYQPDGNGGYKKTEIGMKIQHGVMGAFNAFNAGFSVDILHLILTHTPQSKLKPMFKEGILFSYVDLCDADMLMFESGLPLFK